MVQGRCPRCGSALSEEQLRRGCPTCLLGLGLGIGSGAEPPPDGADGADEASAAGEAGAAPVPDLVGPYRIVRRVGEGGMGLVYLAEQQEPIRRRVALKIMRPGLRGDGVVQRFEAERQTLARMDHPSIAKVFDAGQTIDGLLYFAMEYVDGLPITAFCDRERLTVGERIDLMAQACAAVQHAHHKGVIHRDVKPSNVLVATEEDGTRRVKVIDFGVARAIERAADESMTALGMVVGTPAYMSPEQLDSDGGAQVDTRTDVYGLGVVLYELLTGALPFEPDDLRARGVDHMRRVIREEDPPTPSARLSLPGERTTTAADSRRVDVAGLRRAVRGELDWIVMRALEKDPARRYGSPAELADDLQRYRRDEPVEAGPPSGWYRLRKLVRRHRVLAGSGAAVAAALLLGAIVSVTFAVGQARALKESERQRAIADAVNEFLTKDVLLGADPTLGSKPDTTIRQVVDAASATIGDRFPDEPLVRASIHHTLCRVYYQLGQYEESARHGAEAARLRAAELGADSLPAIESRHMRFLSLINASDYEAADATLSENLAVADSLAGRDDKMHAVAYIDLGTLRRRQGRYPESERAYGRAAELLEASGVDPRALAIAHGNYGLALYSQSKYEQAEAAMRRSLAAWEELTGPDSADVAFVLNNLAHVLMNGAQDDADLREARETFERCYAIRLERLGADHRETLRTRGSIGVLLTREGRHEEAEAVFREVLEARRAVMPEDHVDVMDSRWSLAEARERRGDVEAALAEYRALARDATRAVGAAHWQTKRAIGAWTDVLRARGDGAALRAVWTDHAEALRREIDAGDAPWTTWLTLAGLRLECEIEDLRDPREAVELAGGALAAEGGETPDVYRVLADARMALGERDAALAAARRGLELLPATATDEERATFETRIAEWTSAVADDGEQVP